DGDKLWDPTLRRIDEVLQDEGMTDLVVEALGRRWRHSVGRGRPGTPAEVVLRMLVLKHLYDWSFEECEREVRGSLVYRAFCRIGCESVPDDKTLIRLAPALGPDVLQRIVERLVRLARQRRVVRGLRLRVDTTVVETNIHYPTDSSLLADGDHAGGGTRSTSGGATGREAESEPQARGSRARAWAARTGAAHDRIDQAGARTNQGTCAAGQHALSSQTPQRVRDPHGGDSQ